MPSAEAIIFVAARHTQQKKEGSCFSAQSNLVACHFIAKFFRFFSSKIRVSKTLSLDSSQHFS